MLKKPSPLKQNEDTLFLEPEVSVGYQVEEEERKKKEKERKRKEEEEIKRKKEEEKKREEAKKEEEDPFDFNVDTSTSVNQSNEDAARRDYLFGDREAVQDNVAIPLVTPISVDHKEEIEKREPMKVEDFYSNAIGTSNTSEWGDVVEETTVEDGLRVADRYAPEWLKNAGIGGKSNSQNREEKEKQRVSNKDYINDKQLLQKYINNNYLTKKAYLKDITGTNSISTYAKTDPTYSDLKQKFRNDLLVGPSRTVFPNLKDHDIDSVFEEALHTTDLHERTNSQLDDQNIKKQQIIEDGGDISEYLKKANNGKDNLIKNPNKRELAQINTALDNETDPEKRKQLEYLQGEAIKKIDESSKSFYINKAGQKVETQQKPDFELWFDPTSDVANTATDGGDSSGGSIDLSDPYQAYLAEYNDQPRSKLKKANDDLILEEGGFLLENKEVGDYYVGNKVVAGLLNDKGYKSENGVFKSVPLGDLTALSHAMGKSKFWTPEVFMSKGDIVPQNYEGKPYKDEKDFIDFVKRRREQWYDIKSRDAALEKMYRLNQDPKSFKNSNLGSNIAVGVKSLLMPILKVGGVSEKGFQQHFDRTDRDIRMMARTIIDDEGLPISEATKKATEMNFKEELGQGTFHLMGMLPYFKALGKTSANLGLTQFAMAPGMTRYAKQGRVFTQSMMAKQAAKAGMTVKNYAKAGGWVATEASTWGKLGSLAMVGVLEDVQMEEGLEFLTGEGLGRGTGFGFATARKFLPFSFVDPKSKFHFGTKRNQLNTFLETTIKAPLSFKAGVEFGEVTKSLINDLSNRKDVSSFLEERYGDVSAYGRMSMMDLITGGMLHGTHLKSMDFKRTEDIANLKIESKGLMLENYKKFTETGDKKYLNKAIKHNEVQNKAQERLDQINELDRYTNKSRANEAYKEELAPIVKQFENAGRKLKIKTTDKDIFNDAGDRVDALYIPKGAREKNGKKNDHSEIHIDIRNQKGKGISAHEGMHAYYDLIFEGNVQLKERFRKNFETAIKRVKLDDGRNLYDAILEEKSISKFDKVEEMFSHTAEFLSKAEYYNQLVSGGAFREIKGVVGRFAEKHLGDKLKPDIETEQGLVDLLSRYTESVRKGDGGIKQLERLQNYIERGESAKKTMSTSELNSRVKEIENRKTELLEDISDLRIAKPEGYLDLIKQKTAEYNTQNKIGKDLVAEPLTDFYGERITTKENVERSNINEKSIKKWKEAKEELDKMPDLPKGGRPISPKVEKLTNELRENNKGLLNLFVKDAYTPTMGSEITKAQVKAYTEGTYFNSILNAYTPKIGMPFGAYLKMRLFGKGYNLKNLTGRPLAQGNVFKGITAGRDIDITQRTQSLDVLREGGFDIAGGETALFPIESTGPGGSPRIIPTPKSRLAINKVKAPNIKYEVEVDGKKTELNWRDYIQNRVEADYPNLDFETTKLRDMASYKNHAERARESGVERAVVVGKFGVKPETYAKMTAKGKDGKRTPTAIAWQLRGTKKDPGDIQAVRKVLENRKDLPGIIESVAEGTLDLFDTKTRENIAPEILKGKSAGVPNVLLNNPLLFKVAVKGTGTKGDIYEWSNRLKEYHTTKDLAVKEKFEDDFLDSMKSPQDLKAIMEQYTKLVYAQGVKQYLEKNPEKLEVSEVKKRIELTQAGKPRTAATANLEKETKKILKEFEVEAVKSNRTESEGDIISRLIRKTPYRVENFHDVLEGYIKEKETLKAATVEKQLQVVGEVKRELAPDKTYTKEEFFPGGYKGVSEKSVNKRVVEIVDVKGLDKSKINIQDGLGPRITDPKSSADYIEFAKEDVSTIDPRILNNPKLARFVTNQYGYGQYRPGTNELVEHIKWLDKAKTEGTVVGEQRQIMNAEQQKAFISEALITNAKNSSKTKTFDYKFKDGRNQLNAVKYNNNVDVMRKWHDYLNNPKYKDRSLKTREQMSKDFRENELAADGFTYAETKLANKNMLEYLSSNIANTYNTFAKKPGYGEEFSLNNMHLLYQMQTNLGGAPWRGLATHSAGTLLAQKPIFSPKGVIEYAKMYRSEHEFQAGNFTGNNVLNTIVNASNPKAFLGKYKPMAEKFGQTVIEKSRQKRIDDPKAGGTTGSILAKEQMGPYVPAKANIFQTRADLENTINWETGKTYAEEYQRDLGDFAVIKTLQNKLSNIIGTKASSKLSKSEALRVAKAIDKIKAEGRKKDKKPRGMSTFDFDETVGISDNYIIAKKGKETKKISSKEWPVVGEKLKNEGWEMDFTDFNKVTKGKPGPLMEKLKNQIGKFGNKNVFILTARAPESAPAIHEWLKSEGVKIPLKNITGLGNSTGEAKAMWMLEKFSEGYNDMYFVDDALPNVKAVKNVLGQLDVKSNVQRVLASKDLNNDFNQIIEDVKGVGKEKEFKAVTAKMMGAKKGKWKWVIPPSAADFELLTSYTFAGKGKQGEAHQQWWNDNLFKPFAKGINEINTAKQSTANDYLALRKLMPSARKMLKKKVAGTGFTHDAAIRVHRWTEAGYEVPGISKKDLKLLNDVVNNNAELKAFSDQLGLISKTKEGWVEPTEHWLTENITADLHAVTTRVGRKHHLAEWIENKNIVFSKKNMNKIEALYGKGHRDALEDMLYRMEHGTNRTTGRNALTNKFMNWTNNSVGAVMFFNMRSAGLQLLSSVNYINHAENNIFKAGKAFANQPQYWKDFATIYNSDMLKQRRAGLKMNVNEAEIAAAVEGSSNKAQAALSWLLKKGFTPTQLADSFAIASGGATFYRNRLKMYEKQGLETKEAKKKAWTDFQEIAEKTQQSARPDLISQQQASPLGRLILAFANTPMQYARIMKKGAMDLSSGRGDPKAHVSRILYYGGIQGMIFASLQSGMFSMLFDDELDEDYIDKKQERVLNTMTDGLLRGTGVAGASVSAIKNGVIRFMNENEKGYNQDYMNVVVDMLNVSPTIGSKVRKLKSAGDSYKWNKDVIPEMGFDIENPGIYSAANVVSATTNVPLDRLVTKVNNLKGAIDTENETWQRIAMFMGYNRWDLGMDKPEAVVEAKKVVKEKKKVIAKEKREEKKKIELKEKEKEGEEKQEQQKKEGKQVTCLVCKLPIAEGKKYCTIHEKKEQNETGKKAQCKKVKTDGSQCKMQTSNKSGLCYYHD